LPEPALAAKEARNSKQEIEAWNICSDPSYGGIACGSRLAGKTDFARWADLNK
jgi:hypothetical protein